MKSTWFLLAAILVLIALLFAAVPGCVDQRLPQDQTQAADRIGPILVEVHSDILIQPSIPVAATQPATQPAAAEAIAGIVVTDNSSNSIHVSTQGSTKQEASAAGGSPGPVTNSPDVKPTLDVNLPGSLSQ